eukprot:jgi/Picre1/27138/NNA_000107.t1
MLLLWSSRYVIELGTTVSFWRRARVSGEGVLEVAHEAEEIAEEIVSAVARTSSHVVSAAESGEVITTTSPEKKASKKKKKVVEENS